MTLTEHSIRQLVAMPRALEQWVAAEASTARLSLGETALAVYAECWKSVNGRPYQRYCDPTYDWAAVAPHAHLSPSSLSEIPRALVTSLLGPRALPAWMLPREVGAWGAPSAAEQSAQAAALQWRERGHTVEAFVDVAGRPPWRDRILTSAGHSTASLLCTHGEVELRSNAPHRWDPTFGTPQPNLTARLLPGRWAKLSIGRWHSIRVVGSSTASWLYVMR